VLPFITRVLMEEDTVDDHPALLEAQQTFADILSATAAASSTARSGGSVHQPFPDAPAFAANATWPHQLWSSTRPTSCTSQFAALK
jgi:hypothetical protein